MRSGPEPMKIVVTIKQVPATGADKRYTDDLRLDRAGVEAIINPLDEYAIEQALRLADGGAADPALHHTVRELRRFGQQRLGGAVHFGQQAVFLVDKIIAHHVVDVRVCEQETPWQ